MVQNNLTKKKIFMSAENTWTFLHPLLSFSKEIYRELMAVSLKNYNKLF